MNIKQIITGVLFMLVLQSCAQEQTTTMTTKEAHKMMENLYKDVKYKDKQKLYDLTVFNGACNYKIWVNDMLVYHMVEGVRGELNFTINAKILKSGTQTIKIRIFPYWNRKEQKFEDYLHQYAGLDVTISEIEWDEKTKRFDRFPILTYQTPREGDESLQDNPRGFKFPEGEEQLPYYEETITFTAEVPYTLTGWSNSVDLSQEDPEKLLKEVEAYYFELAKNFEDKNIPAIAQKYYKKEKEIAQAFFHSEKALKSRWHENILEDIIDPTAKMDKMEDYKLEFYGGGKVVNLVDELIGYNPFTLVTENKEGEKWYSTYDIYLHRPKPGAPLEMIR